MKLLFLSVVAVAAQTVMATTDPEFIKTILDETNAKRALHGVQSLTWNSTLAAYAETYAVSAYKCDGILKHSGGPYGENLAAGYTTVGAVDAWYAEIKNYNYSDPGYSHDSSHFTNLVWKSTDSMGCAYIDCGGAWGRYIICEYNPHGNVIGYFSQEVLPLLSVSTSSLSTSVTSTSSFSSSSSFASKSTSFSCDSVCGYASSFTEGSSISSGFSFITRSSVVDVSSAASIPSSFTPVLSAPISSTTIGSFVPISFSFESSAESFDPVSSVLGSSAVSSTSPSASARVSSTVFSKASSAPVMPAPSAKISAISTPASSASITRSSKGSSAESYSPVLPASQISTSTPSASVSDARPSRGSSAPSATASVIKSSDTEFQISTPSPTQPELTKTFTLKNSPTDATYTSFTTVATSTFTSYSSTYVSYTTVYVYTDNHEKRAIETVVPTTAVKVITGGVLTQISTVYITTTHNAATSSISADSAATDTFALTTGNASGTESGVASAAIGQSTTVITVTSCTRNACASTFVTTGVTVITTTVDNIASKLTTYCPLTSESVLSTTVITVIPCSDNICATTAITTGVTAITTTIDDVETGHITYCSFTTDATSISQSSVVGTTPTGTQQFIAVVTVTSCSASECVTSIITTTIDNIKTTYTTHCPLISEATNIPVSAQSTTLVTTTTCSEDVCITIAAITGVTVLTTTAYGKAVSYTTYQPLTSGEVTTSSHIATAISTTSTSAVTKPVSLVSPSSVPFISTGGVTYGASATASVTTYEGDAQYQAIIGPGKFACIFGAVLLFL